MTSAAISLESVPVIVPPGPGPAVSFRVGRGEYHWSKALLAKKPPPPSIFPSSHFAVSASVAGPGRTPWSALLPLRSWSQMFLQTTKGSADQLDPVPSQIRESSRCNQRAMGPLHGAENFTRSSPTSAQLNRAIASSRAAAPRRRAHPHANRLDHRRRQRRRHPPARTSQPVSPSFTIDAGPPRFDRDHRQPTGHRLHQHLAELLVDRSVDEDVACREEVGELLVVVPAGEEDAGHSQALDRLDRVLALPFARVAAEEDERGRLVELDPRLRDRPRSGAGGA